MNNSLTKIWVVILLLAGAFGAFIFWSIKSYNESKESIQSIVMPDVKSAITNTILKSAIQSDLHLHNFILTNDTIQRKLYLENVKNADSLIHELGGLMQNASLSLMQLDTLRKIIDEKTRVNTILIELKKQQSSNLFTQQALNRIKTQISDSAYIDKVITKEHELIAKRDTIELKELIQYPDDYKGLSGFFRKLFGRERIRIDTLTSLEEQINYSLAVSIDSNIVRDYFIDTTLAVVKNILFDVLDKEISLQRNLLKTELSLVNYNELLLQKIRELLFDISKTNEYALRADQESAIERIENSHKEALIIAAAGIFLGFTLLFFLIKDITQTNLYRKKLETEKDRAEKLAAAKEIFLSRMSHELSTPLHSISGFTNLLEKEIPHQSKLRKFINGISSSNLYLNELISNILEQAKINAGTYKLESSRIYIPDLSCELELLFKHRQEEQRNEFRISYSEDLKKYLVVIDRVKLKQVLVNLLSNAFKFTKEGSIFLRFDLKPHTERHKLQIKVADTGVGIAPEFHETIFQSFYQVPADRYLNLSGTGLGLSITKHIVESFGGNIELESVPQKGSAITINLTVNCEPYTEENVVQTQQYDDDVFYPIRVLAVEDDEWNAYLLEHFLKPHVQEMKLCKDANEALEELKQNPVGFDIVLTDLNLPGINGKSFFKSVNELYGTPAIALSASLNKKEREELLRSGFTDAISKPFTREDLFLSLDRLFQNESNGSEADRQYENLEIDWSGITGFIDDDPLQKNELYSRFSTGFISKVEIFEHATKNSDMEELERMAHQLKSNCEQIGILYLSEALQSIEVFATMNNKERALEESRTILPKLAHIVRKLQGIELSKL